LGLPKASQTSLPFPIFLLFFSSSVSITYLII
jgi:hypothetical protein